MADAKGASGAGTYPALAGDLKLATAAYVAYIVLRRQKGMPAFGDNLSDQQVADVVNASAAISATTTRARFSWEICGRCDE